MPMWTDFVDKTFLINLPNEYGRLLKSLKQLQDANIAVQYFEAIHNENGAVGLRETMIRLFHECLDKGYERVLVFEDDIKIVEDVNKYMPVCISQLPKDFDLLYLGAYVITPFKERYSENLFRLDKALATHAVIYTKKVIEFLLPLFEKHSENPRDKTTIDMLILNRVISMGKSYITYPLLISQHNGYSSILKYEIDYKQFIENKYHEYASAHITPVQ